MNETDVKASAEDLIAALPLFRNLKADGSLCELVDILSYRELVPGETVIRQDQPADGLYLLLAGQVQVMVDGAAVARLEAGEAFGEMGLFGEPSRSADVVSLAPGLCAFLGREAFERTLARLPRLATNLIGSLSLRTRALNGVLLAARLAPPAEAPPPAAFANPLELLRAVPVFAAVADERFLSRVVQYLQPAHAAAGERVFARGDAGDKLYLLVEGQARVHLDDLELARLGPGSHVGEMALLDGEPRSADVSCVTACRFLTLTRVQFFAAIAQAPVVARAILDALSTRIRQFSRLVATTEEQPAQAMAVFLETAGISLWQRDAASGRWHMPLPQATAVDYADLTPAEAMPAQEAEGFSQALRADAALFQQALHTRHAAAQGAEALSAADHARLQAVAAAFFSLLRSPLTPRRVHAALADGLYRAYPGHTPLQLRMVLASPTALNEIGDFLAIAQLFRGAGFRVEPQLLAARWENLVEVSDCPAQARDAAFRTCLSGLRERVDTAGFPQARITPIDVEASAQLERIVAPSDVAATIQDVAAAAADIATAPPGLVRNLLWITGFYARQNSLRKLGPVQPLFDLGMRLAIGKRATQEPGSGVALLLTSELNQRLVACYDSGIAVANISVHGATS
jgi:CRP-like cAMP-binding protein